MKDRTILVAEDDPSSSEMLVEMLHLEDYTVETTDLARDTVAALRDRRFDAVLLDLSLPGMSTEELVDALLHVAPRSPLIVFSARPAPEVGAVAEQLGADAVLPKPADIDVMLATIADVVERGLRAA